MANVADLAHSRPHRVEPDAPRDVLNLLRLRLRKIELATDRFWAQCSSDSYARVIGSDARSMPLPNNSVDLVFTSPPYVNAIDYPRAHKFSLFWIGDVLGVSPAAYSALGKEYIGTDRVSIDECRRRISVPLGADLADEAVWQLSRVAERRAGVAHRYFADMRIVLSECARVVRPGRQVVIVVCPSVIAGVPIPTHRILAEMGEGLQEICGCRLSWDETIERTLDDSKRQLPVMRGRFGPGMRTEYVVVMSRR